MNERADMAERANKMEKKKRRRGKRGGRGRNSGEGAGQTVLLGAVVDVAPVRLASPRQVGPGGCCNRKHYVLQLRTSGNWRDEVDHAAARGSAARPL